MARSAPLRPYPCRRLPQCLPAIAMLLLASLLPAAEPAPPPPAPPPPPKAGEFQPNTLLTDGTRQSALWPTPGKGDHTGCNWQDAQGKPVTAAVLRVLLSNAPLPPSIGQGATTFDGQRILGSIEAYTEKEGLKLQSSVLGPVQIPAELLSRVYLQEQPAGDDEESPAQQTPGASAAATLAATQKDLARYRNGDQSPSRLFFLSEGQAKLKSGDDIATAPLERLAFVTLAAPKTMPAATRDLLVLLTDGSRISGDVTALDATHLIVKSSLGLIKLPRALIHSLWPRTDGFRFLARTVPTALVTHGQFDIDFPPRINRTAAGRPFQTAEFNLAGIGMHSYTRAGYSIGGAAKFSAFVTIDEQAPAQGGCTVRVFVDGAKKYEKEIKRSQPGEWLSVPTAGGKLLELEVDFGADQTDVGDLLDWVNAVLIQ